MQRWCKGAEVQRFADFQMGRGAIWTARAAKALAESAAAVDMVPD